MKVPFSQATEGRISGCVDKDHSNRPSSGAFDRQARADKNSLYPENQTYTEKFQNHANPCNQIWLPKRALAIDIPDLPGKAFSEPLRFNCEGVTPLDSARRDVTPQPSKSSLPLIIFEFHGRVAPQQSLQPPPCAPHNDRHERNNLPAAARRLSRHQIPSGSAS